MENNIEKEEGSVVTNRVSISGMVVGDPKFSHEVLGERFYELTLVVPRLSEQVDVIPITISERLIDGVDFSKEICIDGQFRSFNKQSEGKSKLLLSVFAKNIRERDENENSNSIFLSGFVCKKPIFRTTPFKREIADVLLAVNRAYGKSDYIPCIAWGRNAKFVGGLEIGEHIEVLGRIQSREYQKADEFGKMETKTAYEISIAQIHAVEADDVSENE